MRFLQRSHASAFHIDYVSDAKMPPSGRQRPAIATLRSAVGGWFSSGPKTRRAPEQPPHPVRGPTERLGERAVRMGFTTADKVDLACVDQRARAGLGRADRIGAMLLRAGALSGLQLANLLAEEAEGYRVCADGIRLASLLRPMIVGGKRTIVVAGVGPGDASGVVATRAAVALALMDAGAVALVDCDLRRPSLHRLFALDQAPGTQAVLSGRATVQAALRDTGVMGLAVMPAEGGGGSEFLDDARVGDLLALRDGPRVLMMCAPPVLDCPETLVLAARADATILVTAADVGRGADLAEAERLLGAAGAATLGVILSRDGG